MPSIDHRRRPGPGQNPDGGMASQIASRLCRYFDADRSTTPLFEDLATSRVSQGSAPDLHEAVHQLVRRGVNERALLLAEGWGAWILPDRCFEWGKDLLKKLAELHEAIGLDSLGTRVFVRFVLNMRKSFDPEVHDYLRSLMTSNLPVFSGAAAVAMGFDRNDAAHAAWGALKSNHPGARNIVVGSLRREWSPILEDLLRNELGAHPGHKLPKGLVELLGVAPRDYAEPVLVASYEQTFRDKPKVLTHTRLAYFEALGASHPLVLRDLRTCLDTGPIFDSFIPRLASLAVATESADIIEGTLNQARRDGARFEGKAARFHVFVRAGQWDRVIEELKTGNRMDRMYEFANVMVNRPLTVLPPEITSFLEGVIDQPIDESHRDRCLAAGILGSHVPKAHSILLEEGFDGPSLAGFADWDDVSFAVVQDERSAFDLDDHPKTGQALFAGILQDVDVTLMGLDFSEKVLSAYGRVYSSERFVGFEKLCDAVGQVAGSVTHRPFRIEEFLSLFIEAATNGPIVTNSQSESRGNGRTVRFGRWR